MALDFSDRYWKQFAGNAISDLGVGLAQGGFKNAFGQATQVSQQLQPYRQQQLENKLQLERDKDKVQKAADALKKQGFADLSDAVAAESLDPGSAWNEAFKRMSPGYGGAPQDPTETAAGRQQLGQQYGLTGKDLGTYVMTGKLPDGSPMGSIPSGYQPATSGSGLMPVPGGPYDPDNPLNQRKLQVPPSATVQKEVFEADEGAQAGNNVIQSLDAALKLNDQAWDGPLADVTSGGAALFGNGDAVATQSLKNIVTTNALDSLRATFGGNPTEGERQILLDVQGSVNQPRKVREEIFTRAKAAAARRVKFNMDKASAIRGGQYFDEGYSPVNNGSDGASPDDLVNKYLGGQ
jgi:hypothetical protein